MDRCFQVEKSFFSDLGKAVDGFADAAELDGWVHEVGIYEGNDGVGELAAAWSEAWMIVQKLSLIFASFKTLLVPL